MKSKRVAIIGAGPSGLAQMRAFESARRKETILRSSASRSRVIGAVCGTTPGARDWTSMASQFTVPCTATSGPMAPRKGWSSRTTPSTSISQESASYPPRAVLFDYIEGRVKKAGIRDWIRFNTPVRFVRYNPEDETFTVTAHDQIKDTTYDEVFDYVVCASGHFSTPNVPYYEGFETFNGRILHAHDFRDAREFTGKDLLILGSSYSAEDIGSQCWKYGAKSITVAYRHAPMGFKWPDNWKEVPALVGSMVRLPISRMVRPARWMRSSCAPATSTSSISCRTICG